MVVDILVAWHPDDNNDIIYYKVGGVERTVGLQSVHVLLLFCASSPSCWVTQYLHPYELTVVGICTTTCPWCFGAHPLTQWSFMVLCIALSVDAHIGYDLPLSLHHWAPFWGGSIKHDMHHQRPLTNFQPFFNWFDRLFGTECPGQGASGYRPPTLVNWERKHRRAAINAKAVEVAAMTGTDVAAEVGDVDRCRLGNYSDDEPIMEAKRL